MASIKPIRVETAIEALGLVPDEAFAQNGYVVAVFEMDELGKAFEAYYNETDGTRPWVNKDPLAIVKMIDQFIMDNDKDSEHWYSFC